MNESPLLLGHAQSDSQFREEMPHTPWEIGWATMKFAIFTVLGFASFMAILSVVTGDPKMAPGFFIFVNFLGTPVVFLFGFAAVRRYKFDQPTCLVYDGRFVVKIGRAIFDAPLAECTWHEGKISQTNALTFGQNNSYTLLLRGRAILVTVPQSLSRHNRVSVGFTEETYEIWKAFFSLCDVPQRQPKQKGTGKWHERLYQWWLSPA